MCHCYRMLGSLTEAEDTLQEVFVAAWRGLDRFAGRSSVRTWLYRIATNRCLNAIRDGKRRKPAEPISPFGPAARYQQREAVELAFVVASPLTMSTGSSPCCPTRRGWPCRRLRTSTTVVRR